MQSANKDEALEELANVFTVLVRAIVTDAGQVLILSRRNGTAVELNVTADEEQIGRLVGAQGTTARALRRVIAVIAGKHGLYYELNISRYADVA